MESEIPRVTDLNHSPPLYIAVGPDKLVKFCDTEANLHIISGDIAKVNRGKYVDLYVYAGSKRMSEDQT